MMSYQGSGKLLGVRCFSVLVKGQTDIKQSTENITQRCGFLLSLLQMNAAA